MNKKLLSVLALACVSLTVNASYLDLNFLQENWKVEISLQTYLDSPDADGTGIYYIDGIKVGEGPGSIGFGLPENYASIPWLTVGEHFPTFVLESTGETLTALNTYTITEPIGLRSEDVRVPETLSGYWMAAAMIIPLVAARKFRRAM